MKMRFTVVFYIVFFFVYLSKKKKVKHVFYAVMRVTANSLAKKIQRFWMKREGNQGRAYFYYYLFCRNYL